MPHLIALQHVAHEDAGRIAVHARERGWSTSVLRLDQGDAVPTSMRADEILVVMGGPMGVGDRDDPAYPFLHAEIALLRRCLAENRPVIGICLGAQLLAAAAGATVRPLQVGDPPRPLREVGWGAVHLQADAADEPVLAGLDSAEMVLHWHGDTFDLPAGARLLASTLHCPQQMFRLGRAFGLQFHIEIEAPTIMTWLQEDAAYVRGAGGPGHADRIRADTHRFMPIHRPRADRLMGNLLDACTP